MKKIDVKSKIFNEMKLPELFAQVLSKKLDISYEEALKFAEHKFSEKIEEVNKTITHIGKVDNYNVESPMDLDDFTKGKKILKG
tara:strand:- start:1003 stop:1254 length:252 start_codon:yes stop_codon:yes gene_type:complete